MSPLIIIPMTPSLRDKITQDLILDEGEVLDQYICTAGKPTIGVGRNLESPGLSPSEAAVIGSKNPQRITREQSRLLLRNDINRIEEEINTKFPWINHLDEVRYSSFFNMLFQLGEGRFRRFANTIKFAKVGDFKGAAAEMLDSKWARSDSPSRARKHAQRVFSGEFE